METDTMSITRRSLLTAGAAGVMIGALPLRPLRASEDKGLYLSANTGRDGDHRFSAFRADGTLVMDIPVPDRAHGCTLHPDGDTVAVFARAAGAFCGDRKPARKPRAAYNRVGARPPCLRPRHFQR